MAKHIDVYLEIGKKKAFAGGLEWPGWCRSGPDVKAALLALVVYGPRYKKTMGSVTKGLNAPKQISEFKVVERLNGNATTDFGAPGKIPTFDDEDIDEAEVKRLEGFMTAAWKFFDKTATSAKGKNLTKGPRGGGRDLNKIVEHVAGGELSYLYALGKKFNATGKGFGAQIAEERKTFIETLRIRASGELAEPMGRRTAKLWSPRYAVRRAVWHILDHAWEIEDRREA